MKIAVLFGGISTERNVSIAGGKAVVEALREKGHEVIAIDPALGADSEGRAEAMLNNIEAYPSPEELAKFQPRNFMECINSNLFDGVDVAFLVLHGKYGEDGIIQSLLELREIPYTGSSVKANAVGIDKIASKIMLVAAGVPTPAWTVVHDHEVENYELAREIREEIGKALVIKPNDQGSTIGITIVRNGNLDDIHNGLLLAAQYCNTILVEEFIDGRELTVGIVGDEVLPVIEIIAEGGFYDYKRKYSKGHTEYVCPAEISSDIADFTQNLAASAHQALGCYGLSRVDFRLNDEGQAFCLEVNTIPGFTATSLVPKAAKHIGYEFPELCEKIVNLAVERHKRRK